MSGTMHGSINPHRVRMGICTGIEHPNTVVVAVWSEEKNAWVCAGDPRIGLRPCGHSVIVSAKAWVKDASSGM